MKPIGGGKTEELPVVVAGERTRIVARMGLFRLNLGVVQEPEPFTGMLVVPHWEELAKILPKGADRRSFQWKSEHLVFQLVGSVYHAYRQSWHILVKYGLDLRTGEKSTIQTALDLARQLNLAVLGVSPPVDIATLRKETAAIIMRVAKILGKPKKPSKKEALSQLSAIQSGVDILGRPNPSELMARSMALHRLLLERLEEEVMVIDPQIQLRQKALINMIQLAELRLLAVRNFIELLLRRDGLRPVLDPRKREVIATQCEYCARELNSIDFNPYRRNCRETAIDLREVYDCLRQGKVDSKGLLEIRTLLLKCKNALQIKSLQIDLERLIFRLTRVMQQGRKLAVPGTLAEIERIEQELSLIDESHFRKRVCSESRKPLKQAITEIVIGSGDISIKDVREKLILSSQAL